MENNLKELLRILFHHWKNNLNLANCNVQKNNVGSMILESPVLEPTIYTIVSKYEP